MSGDLLALQAAEPAEYHGEVAAALAGVVDRLVEALRMRAEWGGRADRGSGLLRESEVFQHQRGGETGGVVAVGGRGRQWARRRAVVGHRPALARRSRDNVKKLLPV